MIGEVLVVLFLLTKHVEETQRVLWPVLGFVRLYSCFSRCQDFVLANKLRVSFWTWLTCFLVRIWTALNPIPIYPMIWTDSSCKLAVSIQGTSRLSHELGIHMLVKRKRLSARTMHMSCKPWSLKRQSQWILPWSRACRYFCSPR